MNDDMSPEDWPPMSAYAAEPVQRQLPHNLTAEKAFFGAVFTDNRVLERVSEFLRPEHFALPEHGKIYATVLKITEGGGVADPITLAEIFEKDNQLDALGGTQYLAELTMSAVSLVNTKEYARQIYNTYVRRELIGAGNNLLNAAYDDLERSPQEVMEEAERDLYNIAEQSSQNKGGFQDFRSALMQSVSMMEAAYKRDGALAGLSTGIVDLDRKLGGLSNSDLLILAGRPSMGKTALVTNIAFNVAHKHFFTNGDEGAAVGFFSLEMSAEQLSTRILSQQVEISSSKMRNGEITSDQFNTVLKSSQELYKLPLFIDDTPALTVSALRNRARRLKRKHGIGLIVVDYLQLIASPYNNSRNRTNEVEEITRGLKTLAKELDVPVIALSQLSRNVESRDPPRPVLSDLRDSGSIEQDADVVMFVYRPEYYLERKGEPEQKSSETGTTFGKRYSDWLAEMERVKGTGDVIIAKQRHGSIGDVRLSFTGEFTRFADMSHTPSNTPYEDRFS